MDFVSFFKNLFLQSLPYFLGLNHLKPYFSCCNSCCCGISVQAADLFFFKMILFHSEAVTLNTFRINQEWGSSVWGSLRDIKSILACFPPQHKKETNHNVKYDQKNLVFDCWLFLFPEQSKISTIKIQDYLMSHRI